MPSARPGSLNSSRLLPHFARSSALIAAACCLVFNGPGLRAQSVTTAAIRGSVRAVDGTSIDGARVSVVNTATGFVVAAEVRNGRFLVQGLEVGGPYTITAERIGLQPQRRESVFLQLGEPVELHFVMSAAALPLDTVRGAAIPRAHAHGGTATTIADSLLHRLPTLNRDFYEFVRLVPQVSTRIGFPTGFSGGGRGLPLQ